MKTAPTPHPTALWVRVAGVQHAPTRWTYTLTEEKSGSRTDGTSGDHPIPIDTLCSSYLELCDWLRLYGFTPPPPDYFGPTPQELEEGAESILRQVMTRRP